MVSRGLWSLLQVALLRGLRLCVLSQGGRGGATEFWRRRKASLVSLYSASRAACYVVAVVRAAAGCGAFAAAASGPGRALPGLLLLSRGGEFGTRAAWR